MTGAANWWDDMPLANQPSAPPPAANGNGGNWWDSMPLAQGQNAASSKAPMFVGAGAPVSGDSPEAQAYRAQQAQPKQTPKEPGTSAAHLGTQALGGFYSTLYSPMDLSWAAQRYALTNGGTLKREDMPGWAQWYYDQLGEKPPTANFNESIGIGDPQNASERVARAVGGAPAALLEGGGAGSLVAKAAPGTIAGRIGAQMAETPVSAAVPAAVSSGVGQAAAEAVPEPYKGAADTAAQLLSVVPMAAAGKVTSATAQGAKSLVAPMTEAGQRRLAGQRILDAATDPDAVRGNLSAVQGDATQPPQADLVPGSVPTAAAVAGDSGVNQWQRGVSQSSKEATAAFEARDQAQKQAQLTAIRNVAPEGNSSDVGTFFRTQLQQLEDAADQASTSGQQGVAQQTDALGGRQSPEAYGAQMRAELEQKAAASRAQAGQLWDALEPYSKAAVSPDPVLEARTKVLGEMSQQGGDQLGAAEKPLFDAVGGWGDNPVTFGDLRALRSNIGAAQRQIAATEGRESQGFRRLAMLKDGVDNALENAISDVGTIEAQRIADGQMTPEQTVESYLRKHQQDWYEARNAGVQTAGGGSGGGSGRNAGSGSSAVSSVGGAEGESGGGSAGTSGDQGLPPASFDAQARAQYEAAREATLEHKQTFGQGAPGAILAPGPKGAPYRLANSDVAERVLQNPESVRQYVQAGGDTDLLKNYLVSDLRQRNVIDENGQVNASRLNQWLTQRRQVLDQVPDLKDQLSNAKTAQETLDQTLSDHADAIKEFERSKAASFINDDPTKAVGKVFASGNPQQALADLATKVSGDPAATNGLKRAVADYILQRVRGSLAGDTTGIDLSSPRAFRKFVATNRDALKTLFGGQGVNNLDMVVADMRRTAQTQQRLPGQTGTSQDVVPLLKQALKGSFLGKLSAMAGEGGALALAGHQLLSGNLWHGLGLATVGGSAVLVHALRQAGMKRVADLELEAALNPALARDLVREMPQKIPASFQKRIANRIVQSTPSIAIGGAQGGDQNTQP